MATITATTKRYEVIPDGEGKQLITIPAGIFGANETVIDNPVISIEDPKTNGTGIDFGIRFVFQQGSLEQTYIVQERLSYDEVFAMPLGLDLTIAPTWNSDAEKLMYLMGAMANAYEKILLQVSWLKGLIQEKT